MCFKPLSKGRRINLHDGGFGQGVGAHELVIGRMEADRDDTDFA